MKWLVYGNELDRNGDPKIIGEVQTNNNDEDEATLRAEQKYGDTEVNYVIRASHLERSAGRVVVVYE